MSSPGTSEASDASNVEPSLQPAKRSGRKGSKKVRTGCITCKIRKVKCDEAKPFCHRCLQIGRKCDGYRTPARRVSAAREPRCSPSAPLSSIPWLESPEEQLAFDYYVSRSATSLAGSFGASFWAGLVPKLCHTEPAVRHAVLALSSIHKTFDCSAVHARSAPQFSFEHYGKAMTHLRKLGSADETAVPLLVCVLFVAIEFLLADEAASQLHICQGRQILADLQNNLNSPLQRMVTDDLVPMYTRLSLASFLFGRIPAPIPEHLRGPRRPPSEFKTILEASRSLYGLLDDGLRFSRQARPLAYSTQQDHSVLEALVLQQEDLLADLTQWHAAFSVLVATSTRSSSTSIDTAPHIIQIYYHCALIWTSTALSPLETAYDSHTLSFASIITASRAVVDSYCHLGSSTPSFAFESEIVAPLYYCATRCRHPRLRRAAIHILKVGELRNRRENLWDPGLGVAVAERVVEMEEGQAQIITLAPAPTRDTCVDEALDEASKVSLNEPPSLDYGLLDTIPWQLENNRPRVDVETSYGSEQDWWNLPLVGGDGSRPLSEANISSNEKSSTTDSSDPEISDPRPPSSGAGYYPPFGIPDHSRIKNTVIGPKVGRCSWVSFFREPTGYDSAQWDIQREFISPADM